MPRKYALSIDKNHPGIRVGLRQLGFCAIDTFRMGHGNPDLIVVGENRNTNLEEMTWWEIKAKGGTLTPPEEEFFENYGECRSIGIAYCLEDILEWYGWRAQL